MQETQAAGVTGFPVFVGLKVGPLGAQFSVATTNIRNEDDSRFLDFLRSGPVQSGLTLLTTAQPAIKPFSDLAIGFATAFLKRNENKKIQDFTMGLDFDIGSPSGARLSKGTYIAAQATAADLKWSEWKMNPVDGLLVDAATGRVPLPFNYIVFRVSKYPN